MNKLSLVCIIFLFGVLTGCTSATCNAPDSGMECAANQKTAALPSPWHNPLAVQVYPKGTNLQKPYKVLAKKTISKYNPAGNKRQEATIHDAFRDMAASMGGDAVINVTRDQDRVTGTVVTFEENKKIG